MKHGDNVLRVAVNFPAAGFNSGRWKETYLPGAFPFSAGNASRRAASLDREWSPCPVLELRPLK